MPRRLAPVLALSFLACAHAQPPPPPEPPHPIMLLPRSSIAAILAHRGDLELTDDQVQRLEDRDDALELQQAALREDFARREEARKGRSADQQNGQNGASPASQAQPPGGGMGGGFGGGRHRGQQSRTAPIPDRPDPKALEDKLDDNDTRAYLAAEAAVLTEKQKEPARDIAEKYREDLYDQRDQILRQSKTR